MSDSIIITNEETSYIVENIGVVGPQGPQGPTGPTGPQGPEGPQGPQGVQGIQGEQGVQGIQGEIGPQGPQGLQGDVGPSGTSVRIQGTVATVGDLPTNANAGEGYIVTEDGDLYFYTDGDGWTSAGQIVGPQGPQGEQGIQGIQGEVGPQGIQGIQGEQGPQGIQGIQGEQGPAGADGASTISELTDADRDGTNTNMFLGSEFPTTIVTNTAKNNIAISANGGSLGLLTSGLSNLAIGEESLTSITTQSYNVAVGRRAGYKQLSDRGTFVGFQAGGGTSAGGFESVAIGFQAGVNASGQGNISVGGRSGSTIFSGSRNISIGNGAGTDTSSRNYSITIGSFLTSGSEDGSIAIGSEYVPKNILRVIDGILSIGGGKVKFPASTTSSASINLASGVAPSVPVDGDLWIESGALKIRLGGVTYNVNLTAA